jgi:hypothetical protein
MILSLYRAVVSDGNGLAAGCGVIGRARLRLDCLFLDFCKMLSLDFDLLLLSVLGLFKLLSLFL